MKMLNSLLAATATALLIGPVHAQSPEREAELTAEREIEAREIEYAERLRDAEERMEQAARQIAEISRERLTQMIEIERRFAISDKPMIGITIDGSSESGPVDGVLVEGVTPGGAAEDAGIRAGDIITSINDEDMSGKNSMAANETLFDFMHGVTEDDTLAIEYLRNGNKGNVELLPRVSESQAFTMVVPDAPNIHIQRIPGVPNAVGQFRFDNKFRWISSGLASMELVELNEGLGKYFGTDSGLLVVSAPDESAYQLEDGDVIQSIDGREPKDVRQALKIFGTYEAGESVTLGIMRDKKKRKLEIEIPARDHRGTRFDFQSPPPVQPARAPRPTAPLAAPRPSVDDIST